MAHKLEIRDFPKVIMKTWNFIIVPAILYNIYNWFYFENDYISVEILKDFN